MKEAMWWEWLVDPLTARIRDWNSPLRIFYADWWPVLVIPMNLYRLIFAPPLWAALLIFAFIMAIGEHREEIRAGRDW